MTLFNIYHSIRSTEIEWRLEKEPTSHDVHIFIRSNCWSSRFYSTYSAPVQPCTNYCTNAWSDVSRRNSRCTTRWIESTSVYSARCYWHAIAYRWKGDRKSTRLNSSHVAISYAVFCLKKKNLYVVAT